MPIIINSCKKDSRDGQQNSVTDPTIIQAKNWYENTYPASNTKIVTQGTGTSAAFSQLISPDWQHATSYSREGQPVLEIPINSSAIFTSVLKNGTTNTILFSQDYSRSSFLLLKDGESYQAYVMTVIADPAYLKNDLTKLDQNKYNKRDSDFTGAVLYSTPKGEFISGWFYNNGDIVNTLQPSNTSGGDVVKSDGLSTQNLHPDLAQVNCTDWYQVSEVNGKVVDVKYLGPICDYTGGGSGNGPGAPPASSGGGAGANPTAPRPRQNCTVTKPLKIQSTDGHLIVNKKDPIIITGNGDGTFPPPTTPPSKPVPCPPVTAFAIPIAFNGIKIDPKKETKCFDKSQPAQMTIYVQQPNPNTRDMMGANSVGHTFVGITQGGVTRNFGFYPNSPNAAVLSSQSSEIHENSGELYHVSISTKITPEQLTKVIDYINNYPPTYTLKSYNCTDFGIAVAAQGGLILPATTGTTNQYGLTFSGRNPGDLGEDIRNMTLPVGTVRSQGQSHAPNKSGTCP